jgi:hypothetical protein
MNSVSVAQVLLVAFALTACEGAAPQARAQVTIDPEQTYQTMSGWEVTSRLWEQNKDENRYDPTWLSLRDEILDRLVDEVGINRIRIELRSGMENPTDYWARFVAGELTYREFRARYYEKINDNDDPQRANPAGFQFSQLDYQVEHLVLPMRERLRARGERLFVNLCFVDFRPDASHGNMQHALAPQEYAELLLAAFEHLRERYGLTPDAVEVILEPENTQHWGGAQIGRGMAAADARLAAAGYRPMFIAPSTTHARRAVELFDAMVREPGAAEAVDTFSYHNYDNPDDSVRAAIRRRAERAGVSTAMLEHLPSDARELYRDITVANASAWQQYGIAHIDTEARDRQGAYLLLANPDAPAGQRVRMASRTGGLAQFFRNVRAGAVRIGASSDDPAVDAAAFVNPDGAHVAILIAARASAIALSGLPAGVYEASYAPENLPPRRLPDVIIVSGESASVSISGRGVFTLRQRLGS